MRKLLAVALLCAPLLGGCQAVNNTIQAISTVASINVEQPVTPEIRRTLHLSYQALQVAGINYLALRQCRGSEPAFPAGSCYRHSVGLAIQVADRRAAAAIATLDRWAIANPRLDARALISGATEAIAGFKAVFATQGIPTPGA